MTLMTMPKGKRVTPSPLSGTWWDPVRIWVFTFLDAPSPQFPLLKLDCETVLANF